MQATTDKLFKVITDLYPKEVVRFVCSDKDFTICGKYEQEKVVLESQIADINFWVEDGGVQKLLNIEPYSSWDKDIPSVVFTRNAIITKSLDYKHQVISVVVLLEKEARSCVHEVTLGKNIINRCQFPVVAFHDVAEILRKYPPLAPFVLKIAPEYRKEVIEIVKLNKMLTAATVLVLSRQGFTQKEALDMIGSKLDDFRQALLEVPIMQDIWKDDIEKAKAESKREAKYEDLLDLLSLRFGNIPKNVQKQLESVNSVNELKLLFVKAVQSASLDEFRVNLK